MRPTLDEAYESVVARLRTLHVEPATVEHEPRTTVGATVPSGEGASRRALEVLERLAAARSSSAGASGLELESTLGEGGMGVVRLATQFAVGRQVAVKTLRPEARSELATLRLLHEAWVAGELEHPNVVPVYDLALDADGAPLVVLRRIRGTAWSALLRDEARVRERYGARDLLEWNLGVLMQVCGAVRFAHSRGILHRDLKPENVMVGEFGEVYLVDWGLAVSLHGDAGGRLFPASQAQAMAGTVAYMAPEMLGGGAAQLSERTDVYLLGATLYEVLTGGPPHAAPNLRAMLHSVLAGPAPLGADVPEELAAICRRAMAVDPEARYEGAEPVRLALADFLRHRESAALARSAGERLAALRALLGPDGDAAVDPGAARLRAYNLYAECRFGFQQALRSWPESAAARDGMLGAVEAMVRYEVRQGDPKAAAVLLAEVPDAPAALVDEVAAAERQRASELERARRAAQIAQQHDPSLGQRARWRALVALGLMWTVMPTVWHVVTRGAGPTRALLLSQPVATAAVVIPVWLWARRAIARTSVNRAAFGIILLALGAQLALQVGALALGLAAPTAQVLNLFLWATMVGTFARVIEWRVAPAAVGYLAAFLAASARPGWRLALMSAAALALTVNVFVIWRPRARGEGEPAA